MSVMSIVKSQQKSDTNNSGDDIMTMSYSESDNTVEVVTSSRKESLPQFQYSREQLIEFSQSPLAKVRPECLDPAFNNARGVWDPELWHLERKRSETPPDDRGIRDPADTHKRRSGDPRERIRKEQDGIILSPQRRSFNSGCYVAPAQQTLGRRSESPTNKSERERDPSHREVQSRRIGSGRIVTRDVWDFRVDKDQDQNSNEFGFQRNSTSSRDERFDRRSFGRDFDRDKDKPRDRNRYNDKRRAYSDSKEEEPEWFSGGPTSQNDKIDLGGFGDFCDEGSIGRSRKGSSQKTGKNNRSSGRKLSEPSPPVSGGSVGQSSASSRRTPTPPGNRSGTVAQPQPTQPHSPIAEETPSPERAALEKGPLSPDAPSDQDSGLPADQLPQSNSSSFSHQHQGLDFNLDDFLKSDSVPGLLANGAVNDSSGGSRFSQWFRRESPVNRQTESRCSSIQDELLNNLISDITEPTIVIPPISESDTYFTPISPAESTTTQQNLVSTDSDNTQKSSLLEMLQRRPQGDSSTSVKTSNIRELEVAGKVHSVEELEAKIRQGMNKTENQNAALNTNAKKEEDLSAFNKLLAQITDGKVIPATAPNGPLPSNIQQLHFTQMLKNSQQNRQVGRQTSMPDQSVNMVGGLDNTNSQNKQTINLPQQQQQQQQQQMQIPKDLVMKLLQVQQQQRQQQQQQEMLSKLIAANQQAQLAQQQRQQQQQAVPSHIGHFTVPPPVHPVLPTVPPSLSPLPPELQVMVNNAQPSHELLQRPEAKAILQGLRYGEITSHHLVQQLQNPAMQHRHREVLLSILKMQMQQGMVHRTASPHLHAGQAPELLHQMMLQQQQQQHQQQQIRIPSPLNNVLPRVPSPRELQLHTQNIMQSALIKKKLEEQRENYRKRQEMQQSLSPNVALANAGGTSVKTGDSAPPKLISPTPLAFTPTSVLRKMTAEKDPENNAATNRNETKSSEQQKMLQQLSTNPPSSQQQSSISQTRSQLQQAVPPNWNVNLPKQQQGRPIVKGNGNFHFGSSIDYQQQQQQQQIHQQRHNAILQGSGNYSSNVGTTRSKLVTHPQNVTAAVATQQLNSLMMMHRPPPPVTQNHPGARAQTLQAQLAGYQQSQQQQQRNINPAVQQILPNQNYNAGRNTSKPVAESHLAGGLQRPTQQQPQPQVQQLLTRNSAIPQQNRSTSPTSNQLARWFSPELLAQARAGQLPNMPPVPSAPNVLSLEELERLQQSAAAAAVHN